MWSPEHLLNSLRGKRILTRVSVSVSRKWSLPMYSSVEFHQGISAAGILQDPEKLSNELNDQALRMVEERGEAYLKKVLVKP